jgi:hypothetical protein
MIPGLLKLHMSSACPYSSEQCLQCMAMDEMTNPQNTWARSFRSRCWAIVEKKGGRNNDAHHDLSRLQRPRTTLSSWEKWTRFPINALSFIRTLTSSKLLLRLWITCNLRRVYCREAESCHVTAATSAKCHITSFTRGY